VTQLLLFVAKNILQVSPHLAKRKLMKTTIALLVVTATLALTVVASAQRAPAQNIFVNTTPPTAVDIVSAQ
jgi:hypothetical protein